MRREDRVLLGEVLLKIASADALQAEVGYIFCPASSGKCYATEAAGAMFELGFVELGFQRMFARLDALNRGSVDVVERLRMRKEAHLLKNDRFNGVWGYGLIYAILKSEWTDFKR